MRALYLIVFVGFVSLLEMAATDDVNYVQLFRDFKREYNKKYKSQDEEDHRFSVFVDNVDIINAHNVLYEGGLSTYEMGINSFTDLTPKEAEERYTGLNILSALNDKNVTYADLSGLRDVKEMASSVNWVERGAVTGVKDQGRNCQSCWAYGATGTLEGQWFLRTGQLIPLSEQNLIDCDRGSQGCSGGYMHSALNYVASNRGINGERVYPYEDRQGLCRFNPGYVAATCLGGVMLPQDEYSLLRAVEQIGPISVGMHAKFPEWANYKKGIFDSRVCSKNIRDINHSVLIVGYGTTDKGELYWLVKNSYGTKWGDNGYVKLLRNVNACGIGLYSVYPAM